MNDIMVSYIIAMNEYSQRVKIYKGKVYPQWVIPYNNQESQMTEFVTLLTHSNQKKNGSRICIRLLGSKGVLHSEEAEVYDETFGWAYGDGKD